MGGIVALRFALRLEQCEIIYGKVVELTLTESAEQKYASCAPFLRWAGSKRRLLPVLKSYWSPSHKRYVEPFAGSACLLFEINPQAAILGDINPELIATYIEIRDRLEGVLAQLRRYKPWDKREYLRIRAWNPARLSPSSRAARFIYLNRFCFNGIYRTNLQGYFNVPYSGVGCGALPPDNIFEACSARLQSARFINDDFGMILRRARAGDFVYMDPPYAMKHKRVFREYDPAAFSLRDVKRLRRWMEKLSERGIDFVVSYGDSPEADLLKADFDCRTVPVRRHIAGFSAHRVTSNEVIITNIASFSHGSC